MPSIAITIDSRCNASCTHCCFSSNPKSGEKLSDARIIELVDEAILSPGVDEVGISGGEALLRPGLVMEIIRRVHRAGKRSTLVTNGFWGHNEARAKLRLTELKTAGLSSLTISYDDFHAEFVPVRRIVNILNANKRVELSCVINVAVTRTHTGNELISALGNAALRTRITKSPVHPVGSASAMDESEFIRDFDSTDSLRCPGFEPLYHFDGNVYPCCSPAVFETALAIGKVDDLSVETAQRKISRNALFGIMRRVGFGWIVNICREQGILDIKAEERFIDACDLCRKLFTDESVIEKLTPHILKEHSRLPRISDHDLVQS